MAFHFKLEHPDGTPAEPPALASAVPTWEPGDTIFLGPGACLRVTGMRAAAEADVHAVLVVERD